MQIGIIDYGAGNLRSVDNVLRSLGFSPRIIDSAASFDQLTHLILPGVGAFGDCMNELRRRDLTNSLREWVLADRPYLGICLGYQILFEASEEAGHTAGLGLLPGRVVRFPDSPGCKVPHMGWNSAQPVAPEDPLWQGLGDEPYFYFVHSFYPVPADPSLVAARTRYGIEFASAVRRGRLLAVQFHPEKSQHAGQGLLRNFLA
jgi:glutamine amidotransferase